MGFLGAVYRLTLIVNLSFLSVFHYVILTSNVAKNLR
jgi:hypothetical protein